MASDREHEHDEHAPGPAEAAAPPTGRVRPRLDKVVFGTAAGVTLAFVAVGALMPRRLQSGAETVLGGIISAFGWAFVLAATGFVVLAVWLALSRFGHIRLGRDEDRPEFSRRSWIAMMFSAGMGIGLMFYGVTEPISHYLTPPVAGVEPGTAEAARQAMNYTMFHWGLHPWSIYAVVGLALAYSSYRKGREGGFSAAFVPLLGSGGQGRQGATRAIDVLAIFATLFGSATSLGLGALQINGGMNEVFGVKLSASVQIIVIALLTLCFVISAVSGVQRGIKWLSNTNMAIALLLLAFLFVVGPTIFILELMPAAGGNYLIALPQMSFRTGAFGGHAWLAQWTIFYWAWWIAWTPFVGAFLARISKGRTIREFVMGVVIVPTVVSLVWFSILGGTAISLQRSGRADIAAANAQSQEKALFAVLQQYPLASVTSVVVVVLVAIFFISGADAASIVMGSLSSSGAEHPRRRITIVWGVLTGAVAAVLLLAGGLQGLQTVTIIAAAPFLLIMVAMCVALVRDLAHDPAAVRQPPDRRRPRVGR
ncbi:MAG TPA: BCCT family transporter [Actinomycetales bacterium]|nr:BCCT family transporter [Actinomycetales bacterium]